ncbi:Mll3258 protein [invertebrate metagenome]|uniref:Mll3258 protein n=1 Tax=invertebrate metagenome TaxID=1711999 RepID=A0A484H7K6_9ZZZZ
MDWSDLDREIACWGAQGRTVTLWWRDDDAAVPDSKLDRLLTIAAAADLPVALAVIPHSMSSSLAERLACADKACTLQHGFAHANHAAAGKPENEHGVERTLEERLEELADGRKRMEALPRFVPVLVPPWNRLPYDLLSHLPTIGLYGVSVWGPRLCTWPAPGVQQVDVHVDVMDWDTRRFCGLNRGLTQLIGHLRARRLGSVDADEPTGVMTHHSFHDEAAWVFLTELLWRTRLHHGVRWLSATAIFTFEV